MQKCSGYELTVKRLAKKEFALFFALDYDMIWVVGVGLLQ